MSSTWKTVSRTSSPCVALRVKVGNGYLLPCRIVDSMDLDDVWGIALNGGHLASVGAS